MPVWLPRVAAECWPVGAPKGENGWRLRLVGKNRLPRSASLKLRAEIDALFAQGQRFPADFFTLIWMPGDKFQYGVFVSNQIGSACRRNRVKRRLREAVRLSRPHLEVNGQVAVLPRAVKREPKLEQLVEDVSRIFQQISKSN